MFWKCQRITSLESDLRLLKKQIEHRNEEIEAL
jgi:hypothetical protein